MFGSGAGTTLRAVLAAQKQDPCPPYQVKVLFTDRPCQFQQIAKEENLPLIDHPWKPPREEYDRIGLELLRKYAPIDMILLAGYMRLFSPIWLSAFPNRILNIHPADLTALDHNGKRRYVGANAVYDALSQGEKQTRSTAILIDANVDEGPILASGPWVPYEGEYPITQERAKAHQEKQKALSDWPVCIAALKLLAKE